MYNPEKVRIMYAGSVILPIAMMIAKTINESSKTGTTSLFHMLLSMRRHQKNCAVPEMSATSTPNQSWNLE